MIWVVNVYSDKFRGRIAVEGRKGQIDIARRACKICSTAHLWALLSAACFILGVKIEIFSRHISDELITIVV